MAIFNSYVSQLPEGNDHPMGPEVSTSICPSRRRTTSGIWSSKWARCGVPVRCSMKPIRCRLWRISMIIDTNIDPETADTININGLVSLMVCYATSNCFLSLLIFAFEKIGGKPKEKHYCREKMQQGDSKVTSSLYALTLVTNWQR